MLKLPPADRTDSSGGSDASSERALAAVRRSARGDRYTSKASAEAVGKIALLEGTCVGEVYELTGGAFDAQRITQGMHIAQMVQYTKAM